MADELVGHVVEVIDDSRLDHHVRHEGEHRDRGEQRIVEAREDRVGHVGDAVLEEQHYGERDEPECREDRHPRKEQSDKQQEDKKDRHRRLSPMATPQSRTVAIKPRSAAPASIGDCAIHIGSSSAPFE